MVEKIQLKCGYNFTLSKLIVFVSCLETPMHIFNTNLPWFLSKINAKPGCYVSM